MFHRAFGRAIQFQNHNKLNYSTVTRSPFSKLSNARFSSRCLSTTSYFSCHPILNFNGQKPLNATHRESRFGSNAPDSPRRPRRHGGSGRPSLPLGWLNRIPSQVIFWGILALNGGVYLMWGFASSQYKDLGNPQAYLWMSRNFLVNLQNVTSGRIWCLITACFSHQDTSHLAFNAITYFFVAQPILTILGNTGFLALYLGGGIAAGLFSLAWRMGVRGGRPTDSSHGASGAIYGLLSYFACAQPQATFLIMGIIPCKAWAWIGFLFLYDGYAAIAEKRAGTDTAGHVGGLLAGVGYFLVRRLGWRL